MFGMKDYNEIDRWSNAMRRKVDIKSSIDMTIAKNEKARRINAQVGGILDDYGSDIRPRPQGGSGTQSATPMQTASAAQRAIAHAYRLGPKQGSQVVSAISAMRPRGYNMGTPIIGRDGTYYERRINEDTGETDYPSTGILAPEAKVGKPSFGFGGVVTDENGNTFIPRYDRKSGDVQGVPLRNYGEGESGQPIKAPGIKYGKPSDYQKTTMELQRERLKIQADWNEFRKKHNIDKLKSDKNDIDVFIFKDDGTAEVNPESKGSARQAARNNLEKNLMNARKLLATARQNEDLFTPEDIQEIEADIDGMNTRLEALNKKPTGEGNSATGEKRIMTREEMIEDFRREEGRNPTGAELESLKGQGLWK